MSLSPITTIRKKEGVGSERFVVSVYDSILGRIVESSADLTERDACAKLSHLTSDEQDALLRLARSRFGSNPDGNYARATRD